ncbi:hypothetical protein BH09VER1_BH09VER1_45580 [soil metagenome]
MRWLLALVVSVSCAWAQGEARGPLIISPEEVAAAFGYEGKLVAEDFASRGLTPPPEVLQAINFTAGDFSFLPTHIEVSAAGRVMTPEVRAEWEKAPAGPQVDGTPFRKMTLADGTKVLLFAMSGKGGTCYTAWLTSKDGRFDLAVNVSIPAGDVRDREPAASGTYEAIFEEPKTALEGLGVAVARIYPIVAANYEKVAKSVTERAKEPGPPSSVPAASPGAAKGAQWKEEMAEKEAQLEEIEQLIRVLEAALAGFKKSAAQGPREQVATTNSFVKCPGLEFSEEETTKQLGALKKRREELREEIKKLEAKPPVTDLNVGKPLGAMVEASFSYESFEEARALMEERAGMKVVVDAGVAEYLNKLWLKRGEGDPRTETKVTAGKFLDAICGSLVLQWRLDAEKRVVVLDVGWRREDVRPAKELLQVVTSGSESPSVMPRYSAEKSAEQQRDAAHGTFRERILHDEEWQEAFDALLSKPDNFAKAWKVRQQSAAESVFVSPEAVKPVLAQGMVATTGKEYVLVLTYQPIPMYPGNGTFAYYWFAKDGRIAGAGLVTSGHRCDLVETKVEAGASAGKASTLKVDLMMNENYPLTARFQLGETGLERVSVTDRIGAGNSFDVGKSVLKE